MFGEIDEDEIKLEDERLNDYDNRLLNRYADRQFLGLAQRCVFLEEAIREVERQYWRDARLDELEGEDSEDWYFFPDGPRDYEEPRWLQNNEEIPSGVREYYFCIVEKSSLPNDLKQRLTKQPRNRTHDWINEGF